MTNNYNYLFQYLEKEKIFFDKSEFLHQIESHPDYPALVAVTDALNFFNISNGVIRVEDSEIDQLPDRYVSFQNHSHKETTPYLVEKKDGLYTMLHDTEILNVSKTDLISGWSSTILLIEKNEDLKAEKASMPKLSFFFFLMLLFSALNFYHYYGSNASGLLFALPLSGILLSIAALKEVFGLKNNFIVNLCSSRGVDSCSVVIKSKKWRLFKFLNFSDLSLVFFFSQAFCLFISTVMGNLYHFLVMQKILLLAALPFIILSVYYQKLVERKWCKICLLIISILALEIILSIYFIEGWFLETKEMALLFGFVFSSLLFIWQRLRKIIEENRKLKKIEVRGNRFIRNYDTFKRFLIASEKTNFKSMDNDGVLLGNPNGGLTIILIFSPFCKHCAKTFEMLTDVLRDYRDQVCFDIRFDLAEQDDLKSHRIHHKILNIYFGRGEKDFLAALQKWFDTNDEKELEKIEVSSVKENVASLLEDQFKMNQENGVIYTPTIIIHNQIYPKEYQKDELVYFLNDLLDDKEFKL